MNPSPKIPAQGLRGYPRVSYAPSTLRGKSSQLKRYVQTFSYTGGTQIWTPPPRARAIYVAGRGEDGTPDSQVWGYDSYTTSTANYSDGRTEYSETYRGTTYYQNPPPNSCSTSTVEGYGTLTQCWEYRSFSYTDPGTVGADTYVNDGVTGARIATCPGGWYGSASDVNLGLIPILQRSYTIFVGYGGYLTVTYIA